MMQGVSTTSGIFRTCTNSAKINIMHNCSQINKPLIFQDGAQLEPEYRVVVELN